MSTLLQDTFTDTNGVNATAHTMDTGPGWVQDATFTGAFLVESNKLQLPTTGRGVVVSDAGATDYTATVDLVIGATSGDFPAEWVFVFRYADADNCWRAQVTGPATGATVAIVEVAGGAATTRDGPYTYPVNYNATNTLELDVSGTTATLKLNGSTVASYASMGTGLTRTKVGLWGLDTNGVGGAVFCYDNFLVAAGGSTYSDSVTEAATAVDSVTDVANLIASNAEAATAVDSVTNTVTLVASVAEAGAGAETVTDTAVLGASITETCAADDTITNGNVYSSSCTDAANATDTVAVTSILVDSVSETATSADAESCTLMTAGAVSEAGAASDAAAALADFLAVLTEAATAAEALTTTGVFSHSVAEAASASDSYTVTSGLLVGRKLIVCGLDTAKKLVYGLDTTKHTVYGAA